MNTERLSHACGHATEQWLPTDDAARGERRAFHANQPCWECRRELEREGAQERATAWRLPALQGTPKQVAWALSLRDRALDEAHEMRDRLQAMGTPMAPLDEAIARLEAKTSAAWWIDHREDTPDTLLMIAAPTASRHRDALPALILADALGGGSEDDLVSPAALDVVRNGGGLGWVDAQTTLGWAMNAGHAAILRAARAAGKEILPEERDWGHVTANTLEWQRGDIPVTPVLASALRAWRATYAYVRFQSAPPAVGELSLRAARLVQEKREELDAAVAAGRITPAVAEWNAAVYAEAVRKAVGSRTADRWDGGCMASVDKKLFALRKERAAELVALAAGR